MNFRILLVTALLAITGCVPKDSAPPPLMIDVKPIQDAAKQLDAATKKLEDAANQIETEKAKSLSKARAAIKGVIIANDKNTVGLPKETVDKEAILADTSMTNAGVVSTPDDILEMTNRVNLMLAGKVQQATEIYNKTYEELNAARMAQARAEAERDNAINEKRASRAAFDEATAKIKADSDANVLGWQQKFKQMEEEKDNDIKRLGQKNAAEDYAFYAKVLSGFSLVMFIIAWFKRSSDVALGGVLCVLGALGYTSLSIFVATKFAFAVSCIVWGSIILGVIAFSIYLVLSHREQIAHNANTAIDNVLKTRKCNALEEIHEAIDKAKIIAPEATEQVLDVLTDVLSKDAKRLIHEMRLKKHDPKQ